MNVNLCVCVSLCVWGRLLPDSRLGLRTGSPRVSLIFFFFFVRRLVFLQFPKVQGICGRQLPLYLVGRGSDKLPKSFPPVIRRRSRLLVSDRGVLSSRGYYICQTPPSRTTSSFLREGLVFLQPQNHPSLLRRSLLEVLRRTRGVFG